MALRLSIAVSTAIVTAALAFAFVAHVRAASNPFDISFPVAELGGCTSMSDCKAFCDKPENASACLSFAQVHGLVSSGDAERVQKIQNVKNGPGGCNSAASCQAYCNDTSHIDECVSYAQQNGLMSGAQLDEAKKVQQAVKNNIAFPGGCTSKDQCQAYCGDPAHASECLAFAKSTGLISDQEAQQAEKILPYMQSGQTPGSCKSKDECEAYCSDQSHVDECAAFAQKAGLATSDQIDAFKKTGGKGPGGCVGVACQAFCQQPENQQTCFQFARQNGLISQQELQQMEQGRQQMKQALEVSSGDLKDCLVSAVGGADAAQQITSDSGSFFGGPDVGMKVGACFQKYPPQMPPFQGQPQGQGEGQQQEGFGNPGNPQQGMPPQSGDQQQNQQGFGTFQQPPSVQNGTMMPPQNMQGGQFNSDQNFNQQQPYRGPMAPENGQFNPDKNFHQLPFHDQGQFQPGTPPFDQNSTQGAAPRGVQPKFPDMQSQFQNQIRQNPVDALQQIGRMNQSDNGTGPQPRQNQNQGSGPVGMPPQPGYQQGNQQGFGIFQQPPSAENRQFNPDQNSYQQRQYSGPMPPQNGTIMSPPPGGYPNAGVPMANPQPMNAVEPMQQSSPASMPAPSGPAPASAPAPAN